MHSECKYMDNTLIKVALKGTEGVGKAYSFVSLYTYSHRQLLKQEHLLSYACRHPRE